MGKPVPRKRSRVIVTRPSYNACHTCRARRIKCDESRPVCQKCLISGRQCLGYRGIELSTATLTSRRNPGGWLMDYSFEAQEPAHQLPWSASQVRQIALLDGVALSASRKINVRSLEQLQMLSNVVEHHFPSDGSEASFAKAASFIARLPAVDLSSALVSNAVDSLCLAHFASKARDQSLLIASRVAYGKVVNALARLMAHPNPKDLPSRRILYSIMMISLYDDAIPVKHRQQNDWETHFWGIHGYLEALGPSALDFRHEFDRRLYQNLRTPLLFLALARRRPLVFAEADWQKATAFPRHLRIYQSFKRDWYATAAPLPGLLRQADRLYSSKREPALSQMLDVFQRINTVCQELMGWLIDEISNHKPRRIVIDDHAALDMAIEEHAFFTTSDVIHDFMDYRGPTMTTRAAVVFLVCLVGNCTLLRFFHFKHFAQSQPRGLRHTIEAHTFRCAIDMCKTVYSFSRLSAVANAHFIGVMLEIAKRFFGDFGAVREAEWCTACTAANRVRIRRVEKIEPPTMCRVASLGGVGLANCVRYQRMK